MDLRFPRSVLLSFYLTPRLQALQLVTRFSSFLGPPAVPLSALRSAYSVPSERGWPPRVVGGRFQREASRCSLEMMRAEPKLPHSRWGSVLWAFPLGFRSAGAQDAAGARGKCSSSRLRSQDPVCPEFSGPALASPHLALLCVPSSAGALRSPPLSPNFLRFSSPGTGF